MNSKQARTLPYELAGTSIAVRDCIAQVERAAAEDRSVLITAERGLDAAAVARAVHGRGARQAGPFVMQSYEGLSAPELERELFGGHQRDGRADLETISSSSALLRANGGVLFLADLDEMPATVQRRLARVLRDGEVRVARRTAPMPLDVCLIGSTVNRLEGTLREDLLRRMPLVVDVPALRQRRDDVPTIAEAMLAAHDQKRRFTPAALTILAALPWRRNTAELAGLIDRLTSTGSAELIRQEDVLAEVQLDRPPVRHAGNLREARRQFERDFIASVLREHSWQMRDAARALGIERANLYRKARQLGIPLRRESEPASRATR